MAAVNGGSKEALGIRFRLTDNSPATLYDFFKLGTDTANWSWKAQITTGGAVRITDANGTQIGSDSSQLNTGQWYVLEAVYDKDSASGAIDVWLDDSSIVSATAQDLASTAASTRATFLGPAATTDGDIYYDGFYAYSGASGTSDFLGSTFECITIVGDGTTTGGTALDAGSWANVQELPYNATNTGSYTQDPASPISGYTDTSGGSDAGPSGHSDIDGDSNIKGASYFLVAERGPGGASGDVKDMDIGNSADGTNASKSLTLGASAAWYALTSEAANVVPTSSEYGRLGITHDGARDFIMHDYFLSILHVPTAAPGGDVLAGSLSTIEQGEVASRGMHTIEEGFAA
jgi:hypothetical protein